MPAKLTQQNFIERSIIKHDGKYIYTLVEYVNRRIKVDIICPYHGSFPITPGAHLNGQGCKECKKIKLSLFFRKDLSKVLEEFVDAHGDFYDYSEVDYINSGTSIDIICPKHGIFEKNPTDHKNGSGCNKCYQENRNKTTDQIIKEFKEVHGDTYDYSEVDYSDSRIPVSIICKKHGLFPQRSNAHKYGHGCSQCSSGSFKLTLPGILYYLLDTVTNLYKIGVTNKTVETRFGKLKMKEIQVIKTWSFTNGQDAFDQEQAYHKLFKDQRVDNENFKDVGGYTEFFERDVLELDKNTKE